MQLLNAAIHPFSRLRKVNLILLVLCAASLPLLTFVFNLPVMQDTWIRIGYFWLAALLGGMFFKAWDLNNPPESQRPWEMCIGASALLAASFYMVLSYLPEISTSPFTLSWSEASRYYYASLYLSKQIYGVQVPPTVLHPSRYLMQAVPFLIPGSPIWLHRLWQVLLWNIMPLITGYVLARRLELSDRLLRWMVVLAVFLYLGIGPVYYHLLVPVVLILWGFHSQPNHSKKLHFAVSLLVVLLASAWAGISRINWFPVPGSLAVTLILLEEPLQASTAADQSVKSRWKFPPATWRATGKYLLRLAGWFLVGTATAFASEVLYILWSGNQAEQFTTSLSSSLLWHRLLPNATFPPGILPAILVVSLPLALVALGRLLERHPDRPSWLDFHPLRLVGLTGVLAVFLGGGVIVSLKIGGGSNLHNLDAYMVILLLIASYFLFNRVKPDRAYASETPDSKVETAVSPIRSKLINWGLALALLITSIYTLDSRPPAASAPPDPQVISQNLELIAKAATEARQKGGEVLFLSNRQFLTFHNIDVPLVPDYERVFLMEVAMAGDPAYLGRFYDDLRNQRYALIVSEPLSKEEKDGRVNFGIENNAWVKNVSRFILCYYEPSQTLKEVQVQLLVPSPTPKKNCP
jgi:hypothetical protein